MTVSFVITVPFAFSADRIRIGLSSFTPINAALWIAEDKGLFKKYGIDSEVILIGGASAGGVSSLIAGDVQFLGGAGGAVISAGLNGADVVMIASIVNRGVQRVMARGDIKKPEDLRGKRVGVTRLGAASHLVLSMMLRAWGMNPNDVQTMQIGSSPAMMASKIRFASSVHRWDSRSEEHTSELQSQFHLVCR